MEVPNNKSMKNLLFMYKLNLWKQFLYPVKPYFLNVLVFVFLYLLLQSKNHSQLQNVLILINRLKPLQEDRL